MTSIDQRTRHVGDTVTIGPSWLHDELPIILRETGALAARGVDVLGLSTLGFEVDGTTAHFAVARDRLEVHEGAAAGGPVAALDALAFSDLVQDIASTFGLVLAGRVEVRRGTSDEFVAWEPVLRAVLDERPVYEPGTIAFHSLDGGELDLRRSFRLGDPREEIGHFLAEAGFLHLEGVFTEQEMAVVSADLDAAIAEATQDDGASWWARTEAEGWYASRILGFNLKSPTLQELLSTDRFRAIGNFTDDEMVQRAPRQGDSAEGLHKKVGVVEGISDVSWHKDCSTGGHSRGCSGMITGISVTGADVGSGELGVVAGSRRANVQPVDLHPMLDLPRVPLPTRTGDVTVHCSCTLHMSRPPIERERRVVYTGFGLAPRPGDVEAAVDPEEVRRARAELNDQVRRRQGDGDIRRDASELFALPSDQSRAR
jgi:hypothetical protein